MQRSEKFVLGLPPVEDSFFLIFAGEVAVQHAHQCSVSEYHPIIDVVEQIFSYQHK
jgi:hypothetical protein